MTTRNASTITAMVTVWLDMLNRDELDGGDFHYVMRDGIVPPTLRNGDGVMHSGDIVHAVSGFEGTRYILFLMGEKNKEAELLKDLVMPESFHYDVSSMKELKENCAVIVCNRH
jgi:hypothetical protein